MAIDFAALKTALETDPRYDTAVRAGKNRELLALLDQEEAGQTVFKSVPVDEVREAIGDGVRGLTAAQIQVLRLFVSEQGEVDFRKAATRAEIREIFTGNTTVLGRLQAVATRTRTYGEAFGGTVALHDLWVVLKQIPKSYMATYIARG